jgi:hypothetical protein
VPIGAIFAVLNWTHIHLVSLDTETTESHIACFLPASPWGMPRPLELEERGLQRGWDLLGGWGLLRGGGSPGGNRVIVAFPFASVRVDVFLIERRSHTFDRAQQQKLHFVLTFLSLMGFKHVELIEELDDVFVRNDFVY